MLTRRDAATLIWYGLLFSAIVLWANLRPPVQPASPGHTTRAAFATEIVDRTESSPGVHHVTQHMKR